MPNCIAAPCCRELRIVAEKSSIRGWEEGASNKENAEYGSGFDDLFIEIGPGADAWSLIIS
jgi:hypothetical protein